MKDLLTRQAYPVKVVCRALEVSRSGFYAWSQRPASERVRTDERLAVAVRAAHEAGRQTFGTRRVHAHLASNGFKVGRDRVGRLRRELGLQCRQARCFKVTTDSEHRLPVADNLLEQRFCAEGPDRVWLTDITYIRTDQGWLYLAGIKDLYTCEIVGYAMGERMTHALTLTALNKAWEWRRPLPGLIHHSDRGSQYCAARYRRRLDELRMKASMSRRGNCYDNAPMESFWGSLKTELIHHRRFATRDQAIAEITEWIEIFYNRQRPHSRLGNVPPAVFARRFHQPQQSMH